jgi:hypothetical protein
MSQVVLPLIVNCRQNWLGVARRALVGRRETADLSAHGKTGWARPLIILNPCRDPGSQIEVLDLALFQFDRYPCADLEITAAVDKSRMLPDKISSESRLRGTVTGSFRIASPVSNHSSSNMKTGMQAVPFRNFFRRTLGRGWACGRREARI